MTLCIPNAVATIVPAARGKSAPSASAALGAFRLPSDPLFYATLVLSGIVVGSRYRIVQLSTGVELATGVASATTETLTGLPVYENPMVVQVTVRKGTAPPKYQPLDTQASMIPGSTAVFIGQVADFIA